MEEKQKQGGHYTMQMEDGSICTLQYWTDRTLTIETTKLGKKGKKVVPITETQEFPIPEIDQNIEDYELSMESGKIEAVKK